MALELLLMEASGEFANQVAKRGAPIGLTGAAIEVTGAVVDRGSYFIGAAGAVEGDRQDEIAQTLAEALDPLEQGHELLTVCAFEQHVAFDEP